MPDMWMSRRHSADIAEPEFFWRWLRGAAFVPAKFTAIALQTVIGAASAATPSWENVSRFRNELAGHQALRATASRSGSSSASGSALDLPKGRRICLEDTERRRHNPPVSDFGIH